MVGDGEIQEGEVWEAAMAANFHTAGNLKLIIDRNGIQNDDFVNVQMEVGDVASKFSSFGWKVLEIDGHSMVAKGLQRICKGGAGLLQPKTEETLLCRQ